MSGNTLFHSSEGMSEILFITLVLKADRSCRFEITNYIVLMLPIYNCLSNRFRRDGYLIDLAGKRKIEENYCVKNKAY